MLGQAATSNASVVQSLMLLHKMGILSDAELKAKVMQLTPGGNIEKTAVCTPELQKSRKSRKSRKRARAATPDDIDEEIARNVGFHAEPEPKKGRPGKPTVNLCSLRRIVKDTTRLRFFSQCRKPDSLLWYRTPSGAQQMRRMLFARAAQEPMNAIYRQHPGPTRGVQVPRMLTVIKWQVSKDRANWIGKIPKRQMLFGAESTFDWEGELAKINHKNSLYKGPENNAMASPEMANNVMASPEMVATNAMASPEMAATNAMASPEMAATNAMASPEMASADKTTTKSMKTCPSKVAQKVITSADTKFPALDVDYLKTCLTCGRTLWIGEAMDMPDGVVIACPIDTDWTMDTVSPYCAACWDEEVKVLDVLSGQHKGLGDRKDKKAKATQAKMQKQQAKKQKVTKPQVKKPQVKKNPAKKRQGTKKKKLGGVRVIASPVIRWQVYSHTSQQQTVFFNTTIVTNEFVFCQVGQMVNARWEDRKFYGAFVTSVNDDDTYDVYYTEDSRSFQNVKHADIKAPIMSGKTALRWDQYKHKVFYDEGNESESFRPGEFKVKEVTTDNSFICTRVFGDEDDDDVVFDIGYVIRRIRLYEEE